MKRRGFLTLLGAAGLAPALPGLPVAAGSATSSGLYARALAHAQTRASVSAKGLAHCLKISASQADALMARLRTQGAIAPTQGALRVASRVSNPHLWGLNQAVTPTLNSTGAAQLPRQPITRSTAKSAAPDRNMKMDKFTKLTGVAAPMPLVNIDTDMIIPKQFLKTIKRSGLGANLFDEMRFDREGNEIEEFVLNKPAYRKAEILVAGDNFGCGSSREHAPWALLDFGIRCVISTSFADIFYNNCFKNGILPVVLPQEQVDQLMAEAERGENARLTVDLEAQEISTSDGEVFAFEVDSHKRHCLLNGLDDIGQTLEKANAIDAFESAASQARPWV